MISEGGNAIPDSVDVPKAAVPGVVAAAKGALPPELLQRMQLDIGSAGYKGASGDIDIMVDANDVVQLFNTANEKDPVKSAKKALEAFFQKQGLQSVTKGNNVHIGIPFEGGMAQVDVMVIHDPHIVAPYHQHGPRGSYDDPDFKGDAIFIVMNSIGKALGLKFDAFGAKLMRRDNNEVVARDRDAVAKILLNPKATADDLNSVKSILRALQDDPQRDTKLAQAREDAAKGIITLPESVQIGSPSWFRQMQNILVK
jgi:hypothetical protein